MHEEARRRALAFMVRDFPFQSQFIFVIRFAQRRAHELR
jgi:hypothetical protein